MLVDYDSSLHKHLIVEASRQERTITHIKNYLTNFCNVKWPYGFNNNTSKSAVELDRDICDVWRELNEESESDC